MGQPIAGLWKSNFANYTGAARWGTGINPVHSQYGEGPPLAVTGRDPGPDDQEGLPEDVPDGLVAVEQFGYTPDDLPMLETYAYWEQRPGWDVLPQEFRADTEAMPPWGNYNLTGGAFYRTLQAGVPHERATALQDPSETVSEGWENKSHGQVNDAEVSDDSQYTRQTSIQQVNPAPGRNNAAAVARATDFPREKIMTRLTGMKIKPFSGGERHRDMEPRAQDLMLRPFLYRTMATDDPAKMAPNAMYVSEPITRNAPPDPYMGQDSTDMEGADSSGYGYTLEDYYA